MALDVRKRRDGGLRRRQRGRRGCSAEPPWAFSGVCLSCGQGRPGRKELPDSEIQKPEPMTKSDSDSWTSFRSPPCLARSYREPCAAGIFIRLLPTRNRKFLEAYAFSEVGKETEPGAESLLAAWGFDSGGVTLWSDHLVLSDAQRAWGGSKAHQPVCVWWGGPVGDRQL